MIMIKNYFQHVKVFRKIFGVPKQITKYCEALMRGICMENFIELWLLEDSSWYGTYWSQKNDSSTYHKECKFSVLVLVRGKFI